MQSLWLLLLLYLLILLHSLWLLLLLFMTRVLGGTATRCVFAIIAIAAAVIAAIQVLPLLPSELVLLLRVVIVVVVVVVRLLALERMQGGDSCSRNGGRGVGGLRHDGSRIAQHSALLAEGGDRRRWSKEGLDEVAGLRGGSR